MVGVGVGNTTHTEKEVTEAMCVLPTYRAPNRAIDRGACYGQVHSGSSDFLCSLRNDHRCDLRQPIGKARKSPRVFRLEWSLSVSRKLLILRHCNSLRHGLMFLMSF